jgi:hypothetical protein
MKAAVREAQHHYETLLLHLPATVAQVGSGVTAPRTGGLETP